MIASTTSSSSSVKPLARSCDVLGGDDTQHLFYRSVTAGCLHPCIGGERLPAGRLSDPFDIASRCTARYCIPHVFVHQDELEHTEPALIARSTACCAARPPGYLTVADARRQ